MRIKQNLPRPRSAALPNWRGLGLAATLLAGVPHVLLLPAAAQTQQAADAAPSEEDEPVVAYAVTLPDTADDALDDAIRRASALEQLRETAPTDGFGLVSRALAEADNIRSALRSEGYYAGTSRVTVAGAAPDTPGLADRLQARAAPRNRPEGQAATEPVPVVITVEPGPQYKLAPVRVQADPPGTPIDAAGPTELEAGAPARAQPILDAQGTLATALRDASYPFAEIRRRITVDHDTRLMEVTFIVAPGPRADFAVPSVTGEQRTNSSLVAAVARPLGGQPYNPKTLEETRQDLLGLGVFSTVRARAGERLDEEGRLPVTFTVIERPLHAIGFGAAYETRYGPTFSTYWEHRNLFGGAEKLRLEAEVNRLGVSGDTSETGGRVGASLATPWFAGRDQTLTFSIAGVRERLDAYDRDAFTADAILERNVSKRLTFGFGPQVEFSRVTQDDVTTDYQLIGLLGQLRWNDTDSPLNPSRGTRAAVLVNPVYSLGESNAFTRLRLQGSTYLDMSGDKGSILALRGVVGSIVGASFGGVPPDKRFYSGGGGSVRGYDYQSIGPRTARNEPAGGLSLIEGSVELRQRVSGPWGMAAFVDAGAVTEDPTPTFDNLKVGAGLGVRYQTAIGPIRADVAIPLNKERDDAAFGFYIGIGQAF
ncbi:autotransporter assembly complex protein TamA [Teichococcus oryzae]|uniref:Outer membrane protein assembly factor n=1 Tax=Teichococcus oryzae TaxID=1608942 RepID=A0A5B2TFY2_9PROT|nr:autotransporter assembly complex family protein [Pseudoroseomonas oryzae]KAA2212710.1 outer membrane protein assembly factor [Pseudoroseomonas oryzae]